MKKILLLLLAPFLLKAQQPAENPKEEKRQLLESYRQAIIKDGKNFGTMARLYSEDPGSAKEGGMIYNVKKGAMVEEFEAMAYKLQPGEISEIFETQYGFHFMQLVNRKGDTYDVRHILLMYPK